jgi:hypothetical protein
VERHSRFTLLVKVPSKDTATVVTALSRQIRKLPTSLRCSLTWDRGLEMAKHKSFTVATNVKVYFCDPQSPWQRGTNENTNGLLRQYNDSAALECGKLRIRGAKNESMNRDDISSVWRTGSLPSCHGIHASGFPDRSPPESRISQFPRRTETVVTRDCQGVSSLFVM